MLHSYLGYTPSYKKEEYLKEFIFFTDIYRLFEVDNAESGCANVLRKKIPKGFTIEALDYNRKNAKKHTYKFNGDYFVSKNKDLLAKTYDRDFIITKINDKPITESKKVKKLTKILTTMLKIENDIKKYIKDKNLKLNNERRTLNRIGNYILDYNRPYRKLILNDNFNVEICNQLTRIFLKVNGKEVKKNVN